MYILLTVNVVKGSIFNFNRHIYKFKHGLDFNIYI